VAEVAEVSVGAGGRIRVHRVVCAVDCGAVVNPDTVEAQVEGAVVYGLSAALRNEITVKDGAVVEGNFDGFEPLRMEEMPAVEVHLVPSGEAPGGIGEPGLPPIAPAVANAVAALTGTRLRRLPLGRLT
jgi:isoquinoline 1-oxidoreductase beta subunit